MQPALFNLEDPGSWPEPVTSHLDRSYDLFLDWETRSRSVDVLAYDTAIQALVDALRLYAIGGWHCTRLTEAEINCILSEGMRLPDPTTLEERIEALVADGEIPSEIALRLKTKNQSGDWNRKALVLFLPAATCGRERNWTVLPSLGRRGPLQPSRGRPGNLASDRGRRDAMRRGG
jgi:hypothetical protein